MKIYIFVFPTDIWMSMDWPTECPEFCLVYMEGHQPTPWEKLHQLDPPWPAQNCWNTGKLWPSQGPLASEALALGSLGKNQPSFCPSAAFPLQRAVIIFLIWISPKQELLPIALICEAIKQVGIFSSYFSHFQARLLTPADAAYLFLQIMSFLVLKKSSLSTGTQWPVSSDCIFTDAFLWGQKEILSPPSCLTSSSTWDMEIPSVISVLIPLVIPASLKATEKHPSFPAFLQ